ncbi:hypothetical protein RHMOL_Rhmol06G0193700 [Rhododendron molle]|uniref:Uncharacterized protein n=1 Tax=Rhododendron molle TaxID=49168 RepID=A0ACC0NE64_RHOML|nr:hypothetical protein RHMOL_Rhmol06G0193700 [Rhododendron molle]
MGDAKLSIHESMATYFKSSTTYMEKMANSFGYDKELSARRTMVKDELSKLDITVTEKFKLSAIIVQAEEKVDDFYGTRPRRGKLLWRLSLPVKCMVLSSGNEK